jgi:uncharacterized protein (TIGR04255 family)
MPESARQRQRRRKYDANMLELVLCQIRFPVLHRFDDPSFLAKIQDALRERYPRTRQEEQLAIVVGPAGPVQAPGATLWRYHDLEEEWSVVLQRDSAGLETTKYDQFEPFEDRLLELVDVLQHAGVEVRERLGLRYVNELRHPEVETPADWRTMLNEDLLGIVGGPQLEGELSHAVQEIRLTRDDGSFVLRHGYVGDVPGKAPFYLLDLDYFDERAVRLDRSQVEAQLQGYHNMISKVWEMSLDKPMRQELKDLGGHR